MKKIICIAMQKKSATDDVGYTRRHLKTRYTGGKTRTKELNKSEINIYEFTKPLY